MGTIESLVTILELVFNIDRDKKRRHPKKKKLAVSYTSGTSVARTQAHTNREHSRARIYVTSYTCMYAQTPMYRCKDACTITWIWYMPHKAE